MQLSSYISWKEEYSFELGTPTVVLNDKPKDGLSSLFRGLVLKKSDVSGILHDPRRKYSPIETCEPSKSIKLDYFYENMT